MASRERVRRWASGPDGPRAEVVLDAARFGAPGSLVCFRLHPAGHGPSITDPPMGGLEDLADLRVLSLQVVEDRPSGTSAEGTYLPDGRLVWDRRVLAAGRGGDRLRTAARRVEGWTEGLGQSGRPPENYSADVVRYAAEVDRRIRDDESTALSDLAVLGWNPRTVRRHLQDAGYRDWRTFVESRRAVRRG